MATDNVGSIVYDAKIETSGLRKDAKEAEGIVESTGGSIAGMAGKFTAIAAAAAAAAAAAIGVAGIAAAKASWDQVDAVQQATVGLSAYEKNADKVSSTLADLIKYARSDMGVLFNRKDLFESAQSLKIMGDNTDDLVGHVQILSRSVGLGLSNWADLNLIVGRVGSTGRLTGEDFDNLTKAGFKLDSGLRNTNITFADLFKQLDKGIPVDALEGQANTIKGLGIRFETAFRGIGDAILGVDSETSKFIKGGLGDTLTNALSGATGALKTFQQPIRDTMKGLGDIASQIGDYLGPKFDELFKTIEKNAPVMRDFYDNVLVPIGTVLGTVIVVAVGALVDSLAQLIDWGSKAYVAIRDGLGRLKETLQPGFDWFMIHVWPSLVIIGDWIKNEFMKAWDDLKKSIEDLNDELKKAGINIDTVQLSLGLLLAIMVLAAAPVIILATVIGGLVLVIMKVSAWFTHLQADIVTFVSVGVGALSGFVSTVGTLFGGAINWLWNAGRDIIMGLINGIVSMANGVYSGIKGVSDQIGKFFAGAGSWLYGVGQSIIQGLINGIKNMAGGVVSAAVSAANGAVDAVKKTLGIQSPSKVFAGLGMNIAQGLAQGIDSNAGLAANAMGNLSNGLAINTPLSLSGNDAITGMSGGSALTNNIGTVIVNNKADADYLLSRLTRETEIYDNGSTPVRKFA